MFTWKNLTVLVPILLCGCTNGFDRAALQERLNDGSLQMPDAAIAEARAMKPQLKFPCRIAVYLKPADHSEWRWTPEDRAAMEQWAAALKREGIASEVLPLPELLTNSKSDVKDLRLAAAKCGADVLFVIHGAADTLRYANPLSVFNLTVIGGYIVPGSSRESLFMMEGVLLDVDNGYIYTGMQAEGVGKIIRPTFVIEDKDAVSLAKTKAVAQFGDELLKRMRTLAAGPVFHSNVNWKSVTEPPVAQDKPATGHTSGLTPAGTFAPDLDVPIRKP